MTTYRVTCIPGDGIGPEIMAAAKVALAATGVHIDWIDVEAGADVMDKYGTPLPQAVIDSVRDTKVAIKGPITTPVGSGFRSVNVGLRKELDLYANLRPAVSIPGVVSRYEDVDLVIVRENTEDLYAGVEHMVGADAAESIKIITRKGSDRIARFAFDYARREKRRKVTAVHKANIMKCTDGLFLEVAREVAQGYPDIEFEDRIVDNMCMQLVQKPELYDVLQHRRGDGRVRAGTRLRAQVRGTRQSRPDRPGAVGRPHAGTPRRGRGRSRSLRSGADRHRGGAPRDL